MNVKVLFQKTQKRLLRVRLRPIHVFCFHQVSDVFEPETMWECDWTQTDVFKKKILALKEEYTFVSLTEAYNHIANDKIRLKKYAALTADDGWASLKNIIPWLAEQGVPITLFLNPAYSDGKHFRERETERYLTEQNLELFAKIYTNISFGMYGWDHTDVSKQDESVFRNNIGQSVKALNRYGKFVHFFAYPWGRHNTVNDCVLKEYALVPVLMDGMKNYNDATVIHRELLT
jgi:peptidoglycan/xylan/chitin deacetylase (PgdA/CDA1 family)